MGERQYEVNFGAGTSRVSDNTVQFVDKTKDDLIPKKSRVIYYKNYKEFKLWKSSTEFKSSEEKVLLAYFNFLSGKKSPSFLWSLYSMLRACIFAEENVDISNYTSLKSFIKGNLVGYEPKRTKVFTSEEISKFLRDAPDFKYLWVKAIAIVAISGASKREEIYNLSIDDIQFNETSAVITIPTSKIYRKKSFVIAGDFYKIFKKYYDLRPKGTTLKKFFLGYHKGYCVNQVMGVNTIGKASKTIASFLQLPDANDYTSNCFRRTSAILTEKPRDISNIFERSEESISTPDVKRVKLQSGYSKSDSEMQKNILKRLRSNFDSMTRDDLENLIAMKICESIINNSEFKELLTIVQNQSKTIKSYKEQLISLVTQYDKLKQIVKYFTSVIKLNNEKPLRLTRNVGLQHTVSLAPKLNVPLQGVNDKTSQFVSPTQKESASSTTSQMTMRNSSMQHRSMELNKNSDSKPKIVFVNSGNTILNVCKNATTMKLPKDIKIVPRNSSNAVGKSSERLSSNEGPKINSLFKDVTISSKGSLSIFSNSNAKIARKNINSTEEYMVGRKAVVSTPQSNINKLCGAKKFPSKTISSNCNNTVTQIQIKNDLDEPSFSYLKIYECYKNWKNERGVSSCSEEVLLSYFYDISKKYSPSSLWTIYSHLRSTLLSKENVNIANYVNLKTYLVNKNSEYKNKNINFL